MTARTCALLVLPAAGAGPVHQLADAGGEPAVARLARQLTAHGEAVSVLTWSALVPRLRSALPDDVELAAVDDHDEAATWLARGTGDLLAIEGDVVTGALSLDRLLTATEGRTAVLAAGEGAGGGTVPIRAAYGRVIAIGAGCDPVAGATHVSQGAVAVRAADRPALETRSSTLCPPADPHVPLVATLLSVRRPVAAVFLPRGLPWRRPAAGEDAGEAAREVAATDEDRALLDAAVKPEDGFFATFLVSPYSRYWARWCARRGYTPNQVTVASMGVGLLAAAAFAVGQRPAVVTGAVLLQLAFTLDCVDGQLARYTGTFSSFGAWLDSIFDRAKEYAVLAGLVVGGIRVGDDASLWLLAAAALTLQVFRHTLDFGYAAHRRAGLAGATLRPLGAPDDPDAAPLDASATTPPGGQRVSLPRQAVATLRRAERVTALKWAKRVITLPIGERFALISLLAAISTPRVTFLGLLAWGAVATIYTFGGRLLRSLA